MTERRKNDLELFSRISSLESGQAVANNEIAHIKTEVEAMRVATDTLTVRMSRYGGVVTGVAIAVSTMWAAAIAVWRYAFTNGGHS